MERGRRWSVLMRSLGMNLHWLLLLLTGGLLLLLFWAPLIGGGYLTDGLKIAGQLVMASLFGIVQFVAIYAFLGRGRVYWLKAGETGVTFDDWKGNPEVLEVARRIVTLLRGVRQFKKMGGKVSRGLLLEGPPGTGKSYLAQAIATEADLPFCYVSAPSLQNMFLGIGNLRIMLVYKKARKLARKYGGAIVFMDEIDAIGLARAGGGGGGGGMLGGGGLGMINELLLQMDPPNMDDGLFNRLLRAIALRTRSAEQPNILTVAATNLASVLDPALLRPGRFDRQIHVAAPDLDGRKEVIEYYLEKVLHEGVSVDRLAVETAGYTPVQIKHVINEAVVLAHFDGRTHMLYKDFAAARDIYEYGLRQPIRNMSEEERRVVAYHEAGHAVAGYLLIKNPPVKATIIRYGDALGFVSWRADEERHLRSREELLADIKTSLASLAAERMFLGTNYSGGSGDLRQATRVAAAYLGIYGMGGQWYSQLAFNQTQPDPPMQTKINKLLDEQFKEVEALLVQHRAAVEDIAEALLERLELDKLEIQAIMAAHQQRQSAAAELPADSAEN